MKQRNIRETAVAYFRTSSASNVGEDKDSLKRQRAVVEAFSARQGYDILGDFYDAAVSGADAIEDRPGFAALLDRIENNGVRTVRRKSLRARNEGAHPWYCLAA
jgi:DNA invertase Pin-like site-specific DNA recombinase